MYTIDYFINKFESIPEDKWCVGDIHNTRGQSCAIGHCGVQHFQPLTIEAKALVEIMEPGFPVTQVNDYQNKKYPEPTPRQRIVAKLLYIKANRAVMEANKIISEPQEVLCQ